MAWSSRLAVLETKLDDLSEDVRKHNNLVERMARLEISDKAQWERLDERRDECHELSKEVGELKHKMAQYHH
jgi:DNA repair ATPase RecN